MPEPRPVLIAAGGTGGHVYPALAVAEVLRLRDVPVVWLGTRNGLEARLVPAAGFEIEWVDVAGLRGKSLLQTCLAPLKLVRACIQSWRVISKRRPAAVLGMGGFVAGPGGLVAALRRLPLCIHEQNSVAGMTNRHLARFADRVFTAFPGVLFPGVVDPSSHHLQVGNPVRLAIEQLGDAVAHPSSRIKPERMRDSSSNPCRILIVGGSLGARVLNQCMPDVFAAMHTQVEIRHQSGSAEQDQTVAAYREAGIDATVEAFVDDMAKAYGWADLIVCRSGAMTVSELSAAAVPSVLVPYPHAVDDHQTTNARWLAEAGAAILQPQHELDPGVLANDIDALVSDRARLNQMSQNARKLYRGGAAERVADALQELS